MSLIHKGIPQPSTALHGVRWEFNPHDDRPESQQQCAPERFLPWSYYMSYYTEAH